MLLGEGDQIIGVIILQDDVKWIIRGKKEWEQKFEDEGDRLKVLDETFGIKLSPVEREGIKGMVSEIKRQWNIVGPSLVSYNLYTCIGISQIYIK